MTHGEGLRSKGEAGKRATPALLPGLQQPHSCEPTLHSPRELSAGRPGRRAGKPVTLVFGPARQSWRWADLFRSRRPSPGDPAPELPQTLYPPAHQAVEAGTAVCATVTGFGWPSPTFMIKGASHSLSRRTCSSAAKPLGKPLGSPRHTQGDENHSRPALKSRSGPCMGPGHRSQGPMW